MRKKRKKKAQIVRVTEQGNIAKDSYSAGVPVHICGTHE